MRPKRPTVREVLDEWRKHDSWDDVPEGFSRTPQQAASLSLVILSLYFDGADVGREGDDK